MYTTEFIVNKAHIYNKASLLALYLLSTVVAFISWDTISTEEPAPDARLKEVVIHPKLAPVFINVACIKFSPVD